MDFDFSSAFQLVKEALGLAKAAKDLLPDSPQKTASESALVDADRAVRIAEAQIADLLNYHLCKCDFPPSIALRKPDGSERCPKCGRNVLEDYRPRGGGHY